MFRYVLMFKSKCIFGVFRKDTVVVFARKRVGCGMAKPWRKLLPYTIIIYKKG